MTREEIIKKGNEKFPQDIIEIINDDGSITREDVNLKLRKAYVEGLIDNNISLPSNLDEAAEEYAWQKEEPLAEGERLSACFNPRMESFKAGAEWHARQGQTSESVVWKDSDDGLYAEAFVDENKFKMADGVIIQVRKID